MRTPRGWRWICWPIQWPKLENTIYLLCIYFFTDNGNWKVICDRFHVRSIRNEDGGLDSKQLPSIREKTGLSQERFSTAFGITPGTLRHWERRQNQR